MSNHNSEMISKLMPVLFIGHGSPMNAIEENQWSHAFRALSTQLPKPKSILAISAHWFVPGTFVTGNDQPETIHDFGGFPKELYEVEYPAPGSHELAKRVVELIGEERCSVRNDWGLDHGTWSVLMYLFPNADVPVVQLSINRRLTAMEHIDIGKSLRALRSEEVLVIGSGNITHNLADAFSRYENKEPKTPDWAERFDKKVAEILTNREFEMLAQIVETADGKLAHPTRDHFIPLLYAAGAALHEATITFPITGFDMGSLSMRAVKFG